MNASERANRVDSAGEHDSGLGLLLLLAIVSGFIYGAVIWLSPQFELNVPETRRPIIAILCLFTAAFLVYALAIRVAARLKSDSRLLVIIVGAAVCFRLAVSFSTPIQEVDIYRYVWDGVVASQGVSPFKYAPQAVIFARDNQTSNPELQKLASIANQDPAIGQALDQVHFGELPTVYPPTSQAVFYCAAIVTPAGRTLRTRVWIMKLFLIGFDLATLGLVIRLLRDCELPIGLSIAYAWCPLIMKEVANSGHLDAIAVFLTTLAVYLLVSLLRPANVDANNARKKNGLGIGAWLAAISLILALAVGAKLYPIVLAPLFLFITAKRFGFLQLILPSFVFVAALVVILTPMFSNPQVEKLDVGSSTQMTSSADPGAGIKTFFKYWEMNDFLFLTIVENLKPVDSFPDNNTVWFSFVPDEPRQAVSKFVVANFHTKSFPISANEAPFIATRVATTIAFFLLAISLAWQASRNPTPANVCQSAFLILAWFWLLSPTQNPWYWLWALPFLPFMQNRAWIAIGGLVMIYYLRFWLGYHFADSNVFQTRYAGTQFFDFVVTWIEFGPWFVWLSYEWAYRKIKTQH